VGIAYRIPEVRGRIQFITSIIAQETRDSLEGHCQAHVADPPPRLREQHSTIPEDLSAIITRCMAKARSERYQCVEELMDALEVTAAMTEWNQAKAAAWWRSVVNKSAHDGAPLRQAIFDDERSSWRGNANSISSGL